jgi:hypothetical protein
MTEAKKPFELCCICDKEIKDGEAWAGYGPGDNFHVQCIKDLGANDVVALPAKAKATKATDCGEELNR